MGSAWNETKVGIHETNAQYCVLTMTKFNRSMEVVPRKIRKQK